MTIKASEYEFEAGPLKQGKNTVLFDNTGKELHHAIVAPYAEGASAAEVKKFLKSDEEPKGPPPLDFESAVNTAVLDGGQKQVIDLDLKKPGKYVMVCFIQDRKGGPPHVAKGMVEEFEVQ